MKLIKDYDYDLRAFQQTLMLTKTFAVKSAPDAEASFHGLLGRPIERMSAEQIWDSLITLVLEDPESPQRLEDMEHLFIHGRYIGRLEDIIEKVHSFKRIRDYQKWIICKIRRKRATGTGPKAPVSRPSDLHRGSRSSDDFGNSREWLVPRSFPARRLPNHFLRKFGQSDRISIDGATNEGSPNSDAPDAQRSNSNNDRNQGRYRDT
jgi:hypothetical protein